MNGVVDFTQTSFWISVVSMYVPWAIFFSVVVLTKACSIPRSGTLWPRMVRREPNAEHRNRTITKVLGGRRYLGCYLLAITIFSLGILRDYLYNQALAMQPTNPALQNTPVRALAIVLFIAGNVFVLSSMWMLGVTGTYLGDYFGILMDEMVTGFPFNVLADPMYWGSSANFVAVALWFAKPAGLILSVIVILTYAVALRFEGYVGLTNPVPLRPTSTRRRLSVSAWPRPPQHLPTWPRRPAVRTRPARPPARKPGSVLRSGPKCARGMWPFLHNGAWNAVRRAPRDAGHRGPFDVCSRSAVDVCRYPTEWCAVSPGMAPCACPYRASRRRVHVFRADDPSTTCPQRLYFRIVSIRRYASSSCSPRQCRGTRCD